LTSGDCTALLAEQVRQLTAAWGMYGEFHLHGFDDEQGVAFLDRITNLGFDLPQAAGHRRGDRTGIFWQIEFAVGAGFGDQRI